jgi:hypothetical protein
MENLFHFNKKKPEIGRQLNINFADLEKDKDGKTIYDFLKNAGIKESDEDYQKILNSLAFKNGYFYINGTLANEYFYWRKVYNKDKKQTVLSKGANSDTNKIKQIKKSSEKNLSEKEQRRQDYLYGRN